MRENGCVYLACFTHKDHAYSVSRFPNMEGKMTVLQSVV